MHDDTTGHDFDAELAFRSANDADHLVVSLKSKEAARPQRALQQAAEKQEQEEDAALSIGDLEKITVVRPFSELPASAKRTLVAGWLILVFVILSSFSGGLDLVLTLGIVATFALAFLGTPLILVRLARRIPPARPADRFQTHTGELSHKEALLQIALLPFLLAAAVAVFGAIARHAAGEVLG